MIDIATEFKIAIQQEEAVSFHYEHDGEIQRRVYSPWEIDDDNGLVLGWDHDRAAVRSFRFDRVHGTVDSYPHDDYVRPA